MVHLSSAGIVCALSSVVFFACTATTMLAPSTAIESDAGDGGERTSPVERSPDAGTGITHVDASVNHKTEGKIGSRIDKGYKTVNVDLSGRGSYACGATCQAAGGTCNETTGYSVGEVSRKYANGNGTTDNRLTSCSLPESYESFNTTMTRMTCYCDGMTVPPTVRVTKEEGLFTCSTVCRSWSLACSADRKGKRYGNAQETISTTLSCDASVESGTHHYTCACD